MDDKSIIKTGLDKLISGDSNHPDIEDFIQFVFDKVLATDEEKKLIGDFLPYLKKNANDTIATVNDLRREFNRFKTPSQERELWLILSTALRSLEKKGIVFRSANDSKYSNSNNTIWWKDNNVLMDIDIQKSYDIPYKQEKQRRNSKILSPTNAENLILTIFTEFNGAIVMENIMKIAKHNVDLFSEHISMDQEIGDDDGGEISLHDIIPSKELESDHNLEIQEEVESRTTYIWSEIYGLSRGKDKTIHGDKIFCLYFLPKHSKLANPILSGFGPKSTVNDISRDIGIVLAKYLSFDSIEPENLITSEIQKQIFSQLNAKCSENGYNNNLAL
jgi:hypothetical protein